MDWIVNLDHTIIFAVQESLVNAGITPFMEALSAVGEYGMLWIVLGLILCCTKKYRRVGMAVLLGLIFTIIVGNVFIKGLVMRTRPCYDFPGVSVASVLPAVTSYSFPSGHTFSSFAAATAIACFGRKWWTICAYGVALIMGFSRIYLFVHYPSDVLIGLVLGIIFGILAWKICNWKKVD